MIEENKNASVQEYHSYLHIRCTFFQDFSVEKLRELFMHEN